TPRAARSASGPSASRRRWRLRRAPATRSRVVRSRLQRSRTDRRVMTSPCSPSNTRARRSASRIRRCPRPFPSLAPPPPHTRPACAAVAEYAARVGGMNGRQLEDLRLAVSEVVTNSVMHAYGGPDPGDVRVTATVDAGQLTVVVADAGRGFQAPAFNAGAGWG